MDRLMTLDNLPTLKETLKKYELWPDKRLGQNFLLDQNITDKIARLSGPLDQYTVIEIGPGPGGLTRSLLQAGAKRVIAIELDPRCLTALAELEQAADGRLHVISQDALKINCAELGEGPRKIVANLPYNVATPLLINWLKDIHAFESLTLMFQKEVADRLKASPRTPDYGRLSVMTQKCAYIGHLFDLPPEAFFPPPKVTSSVVQLKAKPEILTETYWKAFEYVVKVAFAQRRKMLRSNLRELNIPELGEVLLSLGIEPTSRAEELSVEDYTHLTDAYLGSQI
jgi:16S rRNA (adenine1518-N6/adenine1519-N6)-dimethyltransferase